MWDDDLILEEIGPTSQPVVPSPVGESAGWGSGSFSAFGQTWVESLEPTVEEKSVANKDTRETGNPAVPSDQQKNVTLLHGIAAPQVFMNHKPKRVRSRAWEQQHSSEILRLSGFPVYMHEKVLGLSDALQVTVGAVARTLLEYSLDCYRRGMLSIVPELSQGKWTLFPTGAGQIAWERTTARTRKKTIRSRKRGRGGIPKKDVLILVGYREIPVGIQAVIREIAKERDVPLSEVGRLLIAHAVSDYEQGLLELRSS
jgi:hypothetical protein